VKKTNPTAQGLRRQAHSMEIAKTWSDLISNVSHFFINKIALFQLRQRGLSEIIPILLEGYLRAVDHTLIEAKIPQKKLEYLKNQISTEDELIAIMRILDANSQFCNYLWTNEHNNEHYSAISCVDQLLASYPFKENEKQLITLQREGNFNITISPLFVNAMLFQLLNTALHLIDKSSNAHIDIYISEETDVHALHFRITTSTISMSAYDHLFEQFLDSNVSSTLPGLGFCRLALLHAGGNISYEIHEGSGITFSMIFPTV
jgi:K+-sensing histidine kinase KdpD